MKNLFFTCLFVLCCFLTFGQTEAQKFKNKQLNNINLSKIDFKDQLSKHDFSYLFTQTDNSIIYGFIGDNYQRIRIKFISVSKDTSSPGIYIVYGKSMVKNNIDEFHGTIKISNIRKSNITEHGCEDEYKYKGFKGQFVILGDYILSENEKQKYSGVFKGTFRTDFFLDKNNKIRYDDIEYCSDSYTNNQFVGQWNAYKGNVVKRCIWGDFRIPNSGDLDIGAGEFSPDEKYLKYGWQSRHDLMVSERDKNAKQIEEAKWWQ
jgi:hypothetical protein